MYWNVPRISSLDFLYHFSSDEEMECGQRGDTVLRAHLLNLVRIHFNELNLRIFYGETFNKWSYLFAGTTPILSIVAAK
jgi:hypothetical protein